MLSFYDENNLIQEVKTGEGKSIICALQAALLCAKRNTVYVATENEALAQEGLDTFYWFYQYLGIPCSYLIIKPSSTFEEVHTHGVHYTTASNLALFNLRMQLEEHPFPENRALICDEIDAILTSTVEYRLAGTLNTEINTQNWKIIYQTIVNFIENKELFSENYCTKEEDIQNLRYFFMINNSDSNLLKLVEKLDNPFLDNLIESALSTLSLKENVDYLIIKKTHLRKAYAAPIIASTNRPDPRVSFSNHVQQFLHVLLEKRHPSFHFEIQSYCQTILAFSPNNLMRMYQSGRIIGFTGTAGSSIELNEFLQRQGLVTYNYPSFSPSQCEQLDTLSCEEIPHSEFINQWLCDYKKLHHTQPILIICSSPQAVLELFEALKANFHCTQHYSGYEEKGQSEGLIIRLAGNESMITIANQSLARGANFQTPHPDGILVINTCTDITSGELWQIMGRTSRNGQKGKFISIINDQSIDAQLKQEKGLSEAFSAHRHSLSLSQQNDRFRKRLFEESRLLIINNLLALRQHANQFLVEQNGYGCTFISYATLINDISQFNLQIEAHYQTLLEISGPIDMEQQNVFLTTLQAHHNEIMMRWLSSKKIKDFQAVEPLIPLNVLFSLKAWDSLSVKQLLLLSLPLKQTWQYAGHQWAQTALKETQELHALWTPYFNNKRSFISTFLDLLFKYQLQIKDIEKIIQLIQKTLLETIEIISSLKIIGTYIPTEKLKQFLTDYVDQLLQKIERQQWDELTLPSIPWDKLYIWYTRISQIGALLSLGGTLAGGPIFFIVSTIVKPALKIWIKKYFKQEESPMEWLQILNGLDDLLSHFSHQMDSLKDKKEWKDTTVADFLALTLPIFTNKDILLLITYFLKRNDRQSIALYFPLIPELLKKLEPYHQEKLKNILNLEVGIFLIKALVEMPAFYSLLKQSFFSEMTTHFSQNDFHFASCFNNLTPSQLLKLIHLLAHPRFYTFLTQLPPQTPVLRLKESLVEQVSEEILQRPIEELQSYQTNHQRIAENTHREMQELEKKFKLSLTTLNHELAKIHKPYQLKPCNLKTSLPKNRFFMNWQLGFASIALGIIIAYNILFFSTMVLITSLCVSACLLHPFAKKMWTHNSSNNKQKSDVNDDEIEPTLVHYVLSEEVTEELEPIREDSPHVKDKSRLDMQNPHPISSTAQAASSASSRFFREPPPQQTPPPSLTPLLYGNRP